MTTPDSLFQTLESYIHQVMQIGDLPGLSLAVTSREDLIYQAVYGHADLASHTPVTPGALFEIGSIGKSFTSFALLQVVEEGLLDLHAPVTTYLPWFQIQSDYPPITIHHLLTHTSGLTNGSDGSQDPRSEVYALRETRLGHAPGEHFHYSNSGYKTLGFVLERLRGQPYAEIIQERILTPLGMHATHAVITHASRPLMAVGYINYYDDRPAQPTRPELVPAPWFETATADGCLASTAADMAAYTRMLLNRGAYPGGRIVSEESFALMTHPHVAREGNVYYGYGLVTLETGGHKWLGHGGGMVGYFSSLYADPESGFGAVALGNGPRFVAFAVRYALALLAANQAGEPLPEPPPLPNPLQVENAVDYAGTYRMDDRQLTFTAQDERLLLHHGGQDLPLEAVDEPDYFYVPHPAFNRFLLHFIRQDEQVVELGIGPDWYVNDRYQGPLHFDLPTEWSAYPGHYRSYNPWYSNFRVVTRKDELLLIHPSGSEQKLVQLDPAYFRIGEEDHSPDQIHFLDLVENQSLRARIAGCDYTRFFTP